MNVDATIEALEQRLQLQTPGTQLFRILIEDQYMEQARVRRKKTGVTHHLLWGLTLGDASHQQKTTFYGHRIKDVIKKAQEWAGLPTKTRNVNKGAATPPG